jgi:serine/threonine-protein kinase
MNGSRALGLAIALTLATVTRAASAGDAAAAAEVLFDEGKRLAQSGDYPGACPKLEESQKLDPGMGTLYRLADCYEHVGRTASAWAAFLEVAGAAKAAGQQARADDAKKRADQLAPQLSKLVVGVAEPELAGLEVRRGDVVIGRAQWGTAMPVDPGELTVEAGAPGRRTWRSTAVIPAHGTRRIDVPKLLPEDAQAPRAMEPPAASAPLPSPGFGTQRAVAVAVGIGGVVALGVGSAFGLASMSKGAEADSHCDGQGLCDDRGISLRRSALGSGTASTIGFVAGGVLLAGAGVLWFTAPSRAAAASASAPPRPRIGVAPRWGGASFHVELP